MSSLAEVSTLLVEQNTVLAMQADATMNTNKEIKKLTGYFTGLDAEERAREASPAIAVPSVPGETEGGTTGRPGLFSGFALTPGALLGLAKSFAFRLLRGGLIVALADNIGKAVAEYFGAEEFEGEITRALTFAGIGSIFGAKFGILAGALGAVLDEETLAKITPIIEDISNSVQQFAKDYLPSIDTLQKGLITGLEGLRNLLQGDFAAIWEEGQVTKTLLLLGGLASIILGPRNALGAAISAVSLAWAPVRMALGKLAGLGTSVAASASVGSVMTAADGREYVSKIGADGKPVADYSKKSVEAAKRSGIPAVAKGGPGAVRGFLARALGFAGPIAMVASLGYIATEAFMTTEMYKSLKKRSDLLDKNLNEGVEGQGSMSTEETAISMQSLDGQTDAERVEFYRRKYEEKTVGRDLNAFGGRTGNTKTEAIINAPQTNNSSSSSVVQNNQVMNSGTTDPSDQLMLGGA